MSSYGYFPADPPEEPETPAKPKRRNARARYCLTEAGTGALTAYRATVKMAQAGDGGREALEAAQAAWGKEQGIEAGDALIMDELEQKPQTILELTRSLDTCGIKRPEVEAAIDRLSAQLLAEPVS